MRLGIFAKTFPGTDPAAVLAATAEAGYAVTQYNMACSGLPPLPEKIDDNVAADVRRAASTSRVALVAVSGTFNMIHPNPKIRADGFHRLAALIAAAPSLGTRLVTLCTGTRDPDDQWRAHPDNATPEAWRDMRTGMEQAILLADRHDVDLGVEPELANVISSAEKARRLIDEMKSPRVKIVFDAANLFEVATPTEQRGIVSRGLDLLADRLAMAHAKDRNADGSFATAGKGVLDYRHYLGELRRVGFQGPLVTHGLQAEEAKGVAAFLRGMLAAVAA